MIQEDLAKAIFKNLSNLDLSPSIASKQYSFRDTLKQTLIDSIGYSTITIESEKMLKIQIQSDEFKTALFSDFYFGHIRTKEQIKNVNNLVASNSQVSWIITTTYYACYFMAVEISKLYGQFIINFSEDEFESILNSSKNEHNIKILKASNNSFKVFISLSDYEGFLDLKLTKEGSKPHQIVWINLFEIIRKLNINENLLLHKNLLMEICDTNNNKWKFPSTIRNEWNYTYANYYSEKGTELGSTFLSIIKRRDSAMNWANKRTIQADEKNITASIAYLYHCLSQTIEIISNRLNNI